jgi:hypothetical protein
MEALQDGFWKQADTVTSVFVHVSVLLAALAGVIKFRLLHIFSRRYKSELECRHHLLFDGRVVFEADYTVSNTGERPIDFTGVSLCLCAAELRDGLLSPNSDRTFARRVLEPIDSEKDRIFHIEAGERSIFTLRAILTSLDPVAFVLCQLTWTHKLQPAPYFGMYVRTESAEQQQTSTVTA